MQGARPRSPLRGLIEGTAFGIQAPLVSQTFSGKMHRSPETTKKQNTTLTTGGVGALHNYSYEVTNQNHNTNQAHNLVDGYSAYNLAMGGTTTPSSQVTVLKRDAQEAGLSNQSADESSESDDEPSAKPALKPGKKTKGRVKIKMEFIQNKLRRYTTFSKRKTGIMKKAYELSTLTGTQVMLLVASETGHVYTFATRKLQPMITSDSGKALIQTCLNSPDVSGGQNDQRMNPTGYEETELNYAVSEEEMRGMEPGSEPIRDPSPPSDSDDVIRRYVSSAPQNLPRPLMARHPMEAHRLGAPKEKRHLLHPRPRLLTAQTRPQAVVVSTASASSNGTNMPGQVSSNALQLNADDFQTDVCGQQYVTIPLPVTLSQQLMQPLLAGQHGVPVRLSTGSTTTLSGQNHMAGVALDAQKRRDRNGK